MLPAQPAPPESHKRRNVMATKTYDERLADMKAAREERGDKEGLYHANINVPVSYTHLRAHET